MYKIFFENRALIFIKIDEKNIFSSDAPKTADDGTQKKYVDIILNWLNNSDIDLSVEDVDDAEALSCALKSIFRLAPAAGGVVCHEKKFVAIMRNGVPDLPKGHIEKGETPSFAALREVKEETGVNGVLDNELPSTWHCYQLGGEWVLKHTFWYLMNPEHETAFAPQQEEGITEVIMVGEDKIDDFLSKTYRSISEILGPCLRYFVAK